MRRVDAPRAGWYPDPESRTNLRWWDGLDWTDVRRAPPSSAETLAAHENAQFRAAPPDFAPGASRVAAAARQQVDSDQLVKDVRTAARSEMQRATDAFNQRALEARLNLTPLITEYTNKAKRWARLLLKLAILAFVVWLAFQIFQQASFWNWVTDRIDDIGNESGMAAAALTGPVGNGLAVDAA
jgi:hypothetical protein